MYYILVQTGNDHYRYDVNHVVEEHGPVTIITCPSRYLAAYQLGRYRSGLRSASTQVYDSLDAARDEVVQARAFLRG